MVGEYVNEPSYVSPVTVPLVLGGDPRGSGGGVAE